MEISSRKLNDGNLSVVFTFHPRDFGTLPNLATLNEKQYWRKTIPLLDFAALEFKLLPSQVYRLITKNPLEFWERIKLPSYIDICRTVEEQNKYAVGMFSVMIYDFQMEVTGTTIAVRFRFLENM